MARLSYKQTMLNSFHDYLQSQIIRERLFNLWKDSRFLTLVFVADNFENTQNADYPENFEFHSDTFASPSFPRVLVLSNAFTNYSNYSVFCTTECFTKII